MRLLDVFSILNEINLSEGIELPVTLFPFPHARYGPEAPEHWSPWRRTGKQNERPQRPKKLAVCGKQLCGYSRQDTGATDINWRVALKLHFFKS